MIARVARGTSLARLHTSSEAARHERYRDQGLWPGEPLLSRYLRLSAARPDALAVADSRGRSLTHRQLQDAADDMADLFVRCGVRPGDIALMAMPNWVEWQVMLLAMLRADIVPATIPVRIDAASLSHVAALIGARLLIVPGGASAQSLEHAAIQVADDCAHALEVLLVSPTGEVDHRPAPARQPPERSGIRALDHVAFTSSTTGPAKAVMHSADTLAALNLSFSQRFGLGADDPIFMASPMGHSVGAYHGGRLALFNASALILQERWEPEQGIELVGRYRCAFTAAATPFLTDLVDAVAPSDASKLASMRWFLCGGAQVPPGLMDRAQIELPRTRVTVLWGMTEGGLTTCLPESPAEKFRTTCGTGLPGLEYHTIDAGGSKLPSEVEGELVMRGPGVFLGYLGQPDLYQSQLVGDGFFRTGDLGIVDTDGYLQITGRLKDIIIRGGVNISPVPIEDALAMHPDIASVAVVGAPDERMGERLCAVVQPRGRRPQLAELQQFIRESGLPKYLAPELLRFVDEMPRTPAGKIRKVDLRPLVKDGMTQPEPDEEQAPNATARATGHE
ncbi:MAG: AMP-binding protein [Hyphomicrobiales bacterium]|nr:AMP-binding protein [Hyphomicrobiales bacterium]